MFSKTEIHWWRWLVRKFAYFISECQCGNEDAKLTLWINASSVTRLFTATTNSSIVLTECCLSVVASVSPSLSSYWTFTDIIIYHYISYVTLTLTSVTIRKHLGNKSCKGNLLRAIFECITVTLQYKNYMCNFLNALEF